VQVNPALTVIKSGLTEENNMKDQICKTVEWTDHHLLLSDFDPDDYSWTRISTLVRGSLSESGISSAAGICTEANVAVKFLKSEQSTFNPDIPKVFRMTTDKGIIKVIGYPNPCRIRTRELADGIYSLVYVAQNVDS
jgi:hypothetical protein